MDSSALRENEQSTELQYHYIKRTTPNLFNQSVGFGTNRRTNPDLCETVYAVHDEGAKDTKPTFSLSSPLCIKGNFIFLQLL
jgi:hypothetical protein